MNRERQYTFELSDDELAALETLRRLADCNSRANLIRTALWQYSEDLGAQLPAGVFDERHGTGKYVRKAKAS